MSTFNHILAVVGTPALALAAARGTWQVSRALLLYRAGSAALKHGSKDDHGKAGLEIVRTLTSDNEPWYRAILPWQRRGDDGP